MGRHNVERVERGPVSERQEVRLRRYDHVGQLVGDGQLNDLNLATTVP
jgi:hypothetical protein